MPNIIEITDFHAPELNPYARLTQNQLRSRLEPEKGIFIAESPKVISRALDAGFVPVSLLMERRQITGPAAEILTRCGDAPIYTADRELLAALTGYELTRGVLCAFQRPKPRTVEELCRNARRVAVLEGIVDSTNVGAIFRSAAALNMDAVLINPSCCDPLCRRAVRVSMGTEAVDSAYRPSPACRGVRCESRGACLDRPDAPCARSQGSSDTFRPRSRPSRPRRRDRTRPRR